MSPTRDVVVAHTIAPQDRDEDMIDDEEDGDEDLEEEEESDEEAGAKARKVRPLLTSSKRLLLPHICSLCEAHSQQHQKCLCFVHGSRCQEGAVF